MKSCVKIVDAFWLQHVIISFQPSTMKLYIRKWRISSLFKCMWIFLSWGFFSFFISKLCVHPLFSMFKFFIGLWLCLLWTKSLNPWFEFFYIYSLYAWCTWRFISKPKMLKVFKVSSRSTTPIWLCLQYSTQNSKTQSPNFLIQICIWFHMWYLLKFLNSFFTIFKIQIENFNSLWTLRNSCKFLTMMSSWWYDNDIA